MSDSHYDVAQICENGHVANSMARDHAASNQDHCDKCGAPTIMACPSPSCQTPIRGFYHASVPSIFDTYAVPRFCYKCGKPFPWTETALDSAKKLVEELDQLDRDEKDKLNGSIGELVQDSPKSQVAAVRFKRLMEKAGGPAADAMRGIVINLFSEAIKKMVF